MPQHHLKRTLGLGALVFYGLGTMVGAGFYALVGKVAREADALLPLALFSAAVVAGFAAWTYSELVARFPKSGGEAVYAQRAFGRRWLGGTVGWAVMTTGIVSAATLAHAFVNYLGVFVDPPNWTVLILFTLALGALTAWGISESVGVAVVITLLEVGGLLAVAALVATQEWRGVPARELLPSSFTEWRSGLTGVFAGAFLAIYAFIGFEDMVNVAEETKRPERDLPRALLLAVLGTTLLYLLVSVFSVLVIPVPELVESEAPLADIVRAQGNGWAILIGVVGLLAGVNGALVQFIMASRVLYGMAREGMAPELFGTVSPSTRTPLTATGAVTTVIGILALGFPLETLARVTSLVILLVFATMHVSLIRLKRRQPRPDGVRLAPGWAPWVGSLLILILLTMQLRDALN